MKNLFEGNINKQPKYELTPSEAAQYLVFRETVQAAVRNFERFLDRPLSRPVPVEDRNVTIQTENKFRAFFGK